MCTRCNYRHCLLVIITFLIPIIACAEIEKFGTTNDKGIELYWWPKLPQLDGWHQDKECSFNYKSNALAPNGFTFANADAVIYARAIYKPRDPDIKNIAQLIERDKKDFQDNVAGIQITEVQKLVTADGKSFRSFTYLPKDKGNWERVTYGEEGDFYLLFALSARSRKGYDNALAAYEKLIKTYKEK